MTQVAVNDTLARDALRLSACKTLEGAMEEALKVFIAVKRGGGVESDVEDELFGMWANRAEMADVGAYVRGLRKGRALP